MEDARDRAAQHFAAVDPDGMLDALRFAGQHLEMAKQIEDAGLSQVRAVGIYAAEQAGFGGNGGPAAADGGVGRIDRLWEGGGGLGFCYKNIHSRKPHPLARAFSSIPPGP